MNKLELRPCLFNEKSPNNTSLFSEGRGEQTCAGKLFYRKFPEVLGEGNYYICTKHDTDLRGIKA